MTCAGRVNYQQNDVILIRVCCGLHFPTSDIVYFCGERPFIILFFIAVFKFTIRRRVSRPPLLFPYMNHQERSTQLLWHHPKRKTVFLRQKRFSQFWNVNGRLKTRGEKKKSYIKEFYFNFFPPVLCVLRTNFSIPIFLKFLLPGKSKHKFDRVTYENGLLKWFFWILI